MTVGKLRYVVFCLLVLVCFAGDAFGALVSPEVHSDLRVTFRVKAAKASSVGVNVQFVRGVQAMSKGDGGVWSVTLGPAEPDIYEYSFVVDGLTVSDQANAWVKVWQGTTKNLVEVGGAEPMFFEEQDVPHGTVNIHRYRSKSLGVTRGLYVYTPPSYETSGKTKYPALYLLHGMGDCGQSDCTEQGQADAYRYAVWAHSQGSGGCKEHREIRGVREGFDRGCCSIHSRELSGKDGP